LAEVTLDVISKVGYMYNGALQ